MTAKELPEYFKPSRVRSHEKPDKEERVKNRVPKHTPYNREHANLKQAYLKGEIDEDE
jgi:hypothetical protein